MQEWEVRMEVVAEAFKTIYLDDDSTEQDAEEAAEDEGCELSDITEIVSSSVHSVKAV